MPVVPRLVLLVCTPAALHRPRCGLALSGFVGRWLGTALALFAIAFLRTLFRRLVIRRVQGKAHDAGSAVTRTAKRMN